ncbi:MAG: hypothetical protein ACE5FP_01255 [Gemmatimonadota bacterium]
MVQADLASGVLAAPFNLEELMAEGNRKKTYMIIMVILIAVLALTFI